MSRLLLLPLFAGLAWPMSVAAATDDPVVIYRCTDASGHLAVQNSPCPDGTEQEVTEMLRPSDAPPRPEPEPEPASTAPAAHAPTQTPPPVVRTIATTYECTTPDGQTYTSHDPSGHPRWVPSWHWSRPGLLPPPHRVPAPPPTLPPARMTSTMPAPSGIDPPSRGSMGTTRSARTAPPPPRTGPHWPRAPVHGVLVPSGQWVRDTCVVLSQAAVCERLRDRRWELGRDYNSALQSERHRIDAEQQSIDTRLAGECR